MRRRPVRRAFAAGFAAVLFAACGKSTEPKAPASIVINPSAVTLNSVGQTQALAATVFDAGGHQLTTASVAWSSDAPAVATVSAAGVVTAAGNGSASVKATSGTAQQTAAVTVALTASQVNKVAGDFQSGTVGTTLANALIAEVDDAGGHPIGGLTVTFAVASGGGSITPTTAVTGADGRASTSWTLGTTSGGQSVSATAPNVTAAVFQATATAGAPASVAVQAGDAQTAAQGTAVATPPAVIVKDGFGNPKPSATVAFAVTSGGGTLTGATVTTNASGVAVVGSWTLGTAGAQGLSATVSGGGGAITGNPVSFTATSIAPGTPTSIAVFDGDNSGLAGFALNVPPSVIVRDSANHPVSGVGVTFAVQTGGGSITGPTTTTGLNGVAQVGSWTVQLGGNTLSATAGAGGLTGNPVTLSATGQSQNYTIVLRYIGTVSAARKAVFDSAAAHWMRIIYGDVPDITLNQPAGQCGANSPAINETVDDVLIFVTLDSIDGPGKILGQAGPCFIRTQGRLPIVGIMHFDTADVANLENSGQFKSVILHEMGHVLGFGTIWDAGDLNLVAGPTSSGGTDPHFIGSQALATFDQLGGTSYTGGSKVPVENTGGAGSLDSHWRESVFGNELMTSLLNGGVTNPLSVLTIASMGDEAYTVNYAAAEPYSHLFSLRAAPAGPPILLEDDIIHLPIYTVDRAGRITGVYRR